MNKNIKVLIADDEPIGRESLRDWLSDTGHQVLMARNGPEALKLVQEQSPGIAFVDLIMPGMDGIELLKKIKDMSPATEVVITTAYASIATAIAATREGAYDYIEKPFSPEKAELLIEKVAERHRLIEENTALLQRRAGPHHAQTIIARSEKMQQVLGFIKLAAGTDAPVLITGERGTGKESIAQSIHLLSRRKNGPLVVVSCAAFPGNILESELFGQDQATSPPTGARRKGEFEAANGGILFLEDIGDMSPSLQVRVLKTLEENELASPDAQEPGPSGFRLISSTSKDIRQATASGYFSEDLYYRLNIVSIELPPLRERKEDIPLLAEFFLRKFSARDRKQVTGFTSEASRFLVEYAWPGNIRELENTIGRAVVLARDTVINVNDLRRESIALSTPLGTTQLLKDVERKHIIDILTRTRGNFSQAARILGISRATLYNKVKAYGLDMKSVNPKS